MADKEKKCFRQLFYLFLIIITFTIHVRCQTSPGPLTDVNEVTMHLCPFLCTIGDQWSCVPPPCPLPPCVDPAKYKPTDCCSYCPNGADCKSPDGVPIKYNRWRIDYGKNCTCMYPPSDATCS